MNSRESFESGLSDANQELVETIYAYLDGTLEAARARQLLGQLEASEEARALFSSCERLFRTLGAERGAPDPAHACRATLVSVRSRLALSRRRVARARWALGIAAALVLFLGIGLALERARDAGQGSAPEGRSLAGIGEDASGGGELETASGVPTWSASPEALRYSEEELELVAFLGREGGEDLSLELVELLLEVTDEEADEDGPSLDENELFGVLLEEELIGENG